MLKKKVLTRYIPVYIISILLFISCASISREVYDAKIKVIPLNSSPQNVRVFLDGKPEGITPTILIITYLQSKYSSHDSETRKRILKIEKYGYEPYILSFSMNDKEYEQIPNPVFLKKSGDNVESEGSLVKEQQTKQELKEVKEKVEEYLKESTKLRNEFAVLKAKKDTQAIIHKPIEVLSAANSVEKELEPKRDMVSGKKYKNDENDNNSNKIIMADDQHASQIIYTIQTGSFLEIERAQKQFNSVVQILNGKELDYLRIEKVGKYYSVRLGKFLDYASAEGFLQTLEPQLAETIILKANIKDDRIIRIYEVGE